MIFDAAKLRADLCSGCSAERFFRRLGSGNQTFPYVSAVVEPGAFLLYGAAVALVVIVAATNRKAHRRLLTQDASSERPTTVTLPAA
jgi:hypothetical protein